MKNTFEDLKVAKAILKTLDDIGFHEPTPVQMETIPKINSGINVVGIAQTGTGKTAAYLLPILTKLKKAEGVDPRAVVIVPTRELSIQVGQTTPDGKFSLSSLRCVGACGLAPVVLVGDKTYGRVAPDDVKSILKEYEG